MISFNRVSALRSLCEAHRCTVTGHCEYAQQCRWTDASVKAPGVPNDQSTHTGFFLKMGHLQDNHFPAYHRSADADWGVRTYRYHREGHVPDQNIEPLGYEYSPPQAGLGQSSMVGQRVDPSTCASTEYARSLRLVLAIQPCLPIHGLTALIDSGPICFFTWSITPPRSRGVG